MAKSYDLYRTCRACLNSDGSKIMHSLREEPLKSMFFECTFVKVKPDDKLPYKICSLCVARCDAAYNFREMCEKSDQEIKTAEIRIESAPPAVQVPRKRSPVKPAKAKATTIAEVLVPEVAEETDAAMNVDSDEHILTEIIIAPESETHDEESQSQLDHLKEEGESMEEHDYVVSYEQSPAEEAQCQFCHEMFAGKIALLDHYAEMHQEETYNCTNCHQIFNKLDDWRAHLCRRPLREKQVLNCEFCDESFKARRYMANHLAEAHAGETYTCANCNRNWKNAETWRTHQCKGDAWEYVCNYCDRTFGFQTLLSRHLKKHLDVASQKPNECDICGERFHSAFYLKQHKLTHTGEMPYGCTHCNRPFRSKCNLLRHIRTVHKDSDIQYKDIQ